MAIAAGTAEPAHVAAPEELTKGVDYYIEDGNLVFTSSYLLKRGYCCNSGCRHCPYGEEAPKLAINIVGSSDDEPQR